MLFLDLRTKITKWPNIAILYQIFRHSCIESAASSAPLQNLAEADVYRDNWASFCHSRMESKAYQEISCNFLSYLSAENPERCSGVIGSMLLSAGCDYHTTVSTEQILWDETSGCDFGESPSLDDKSKYAWCSQLWPISTNVYPGELIYLRLKYYYVYYLVLFSSSVSSAHKAPLPFASFWCLLFLYLYLIYTIATNRLTSLTSTTMGEIPQHQEHILCLLPFPEDSKILDRLRQKYNVEITYKQIFFGVGKALELADVPDGKFTHYLAISLSLSSHFPMCGIWAV